MRSEGDDEDDRWGQRNDHMSMKYWRVTLRAEALPRRRCRCQCHRHAVRVGH